MNHVRSCRLANPTEHERRHDSGVERVSGKDKDFGYRGGELLKSEDGLLSRNEGACCVDVQGFSEVCQWSREWVARRVGFSSCSFEEEPSVGKISVCELMSFTRLSLTIIDNNTWDTQ